MDIANEWSAVRELLDRDEEARARSVALVTPLGSGATMVTFGGAQRQMLPGPVGDLETARLASGAANVTAYIESPTARSSQADSHAWAEITGPDGHIFTAELDTGEGVGATAAIAADTAELVLAGVKPGAWTVGQLFGPGLVTEATGARVTVNRQRV